MLFIKKINITLFEAFINLSFPYVNFFFHFYDHFILTLVGKRTTTKQKQGQCRQRSPFLPGVSEPSHWLWGCPWRRGAEPPSVTLTLPCCLLMARLTLPFALTCFPCCSSVSAGACLSRSPGLCV